MIRKARTNKKTYITLIIILVSLVTITSVPMSCFLANSRINTYTIINQSPSPKQSLLESNKTTNGLDIASLTYNYSSESNHNNANFFR